MTTAQLEPHVHPLASGPLFKAVNDSVANCLTMCNCTARLVGLTTVPVHEPGLVTGLIGVHGKVSGFMTVNMAERFAIRAVSGLVQDKHETLTVEVVDGVGEITNIIAGGIKSALANSNWAFPHITVPSVIIGTGYRMAYARGLEFLSVAFEHDDPTAVMLNDRMLHVSVSLLRL